MKIKMVVTIMIIAFIAGITGCRKPESYYRVEIPPLPEQWDSWVENQKRSGRKILSVTESNQWIEN